MGKSHPSRHPTTDCIAFMREQLLDEIADLSIILDVDKTVPHLRKEYQTATGDSGTRFPTMEMFHHENWGKWQEALAEQVENASSDQIATYFAERFGVRSASDCPVCAR